MQGATPRSRRCLLPWRLPSSSCRRCSRWGTVAIGAGPANQLTEQLIADSCSDSIRVERRAARPVICALDGGAGSGWGKLPGPVAGGAPGVRESKLIQGQIQRVAEGDRGR